MSSRCTLTPSSRARMSSLSSKPHPLLYAQYVKLDALSLHSDLIATGGSAAAAGELIKQSGGKTLEYLFIVGLPFLNVSEVFAWLWSGVIADSEGCVRVGRQEVGCAFLLDDRG